MRVTRFYFGIDKNAGGYNGYDGHSDILFVTDFVGMNTNVLKTQELSFSSISNATLFNLDDTIDVLDIITLVNEVLNSSNLYCAYVYGDLDYNQELNILDIIQLVSLIINN